MKIINPILISLLLLCLGCSGNVEEKIKYGEIFGVVYDKNVGDPIPVAQVQLSPGGKSTVTGSDGSFSFKSIEEGKYSVSVTKKGYNDGNNNVDVVSGEKVECNLLMERIPAYVTSDKTELDFGDNATLTTLSFNIVNSSYESLSWHIDYDKSSSSFIAEVSPESGTTQYGKTAVIVVKINRDKLKTGENESTIVVVSDNGDGSSEVKIKAIGQEIRDVVLNALDVTDVMSTSAVLHGMIVDAGIPKYTERGFVISDTGDPTIGSAIKKVSSILSEETEFSARVEGLNIEKLYYVRSYALSPQGEFYSSNQKTFITVATLPGVSTLEATDVDEGSATAILHGKINDTGDPQYYERGFVYSTAFSNPTVDETKVVVTEGGSDFEKRVSFGSASNPVYVRAYAVNFKGVAYGETVTVFPYSYYIDKAMHIGVQNQDIGYGQWETVNSMCRNSRLAGQNDWRLPTKDELMYLYTNREKIGGFKTRYINYNSRYAETGYWASNTSGASHVIISLMDGSVVLQDETSWSWDPSYVDYISGRCVRTL